MQTDSKALLWSTKSCRKVPFRTLKLFNRALNVSCLDFTRALNFFTSTLSPGRVIAIFPGSPLYPESPTARLVSGIFDLSELPGLFSFLKIVISCWLAGNGPLIHTSRLLRIAMPSSYVNPGPLNLWLNHFAPGSFLTSWMLQ